MRSYEAARSYFSFLSLLSWAAIIVGGFLVMSALIAIEQTSTRTPPPIAYALAVAPGAVLAVAGFFGLIFVQSSRASVDCAEYAQQSLQLSRDQFDVSKQLLQLAQSKDKAAGYEATTSKNELTNISFDTDAPAPIEPEAATYPPPEPEPIADPVPVLEAAATSTAVATLEPNQHDYAGLQIEEQDGKFLIAPQPYDTLRDAKLAIDRLQSEHRSSGAFKLRS